MWDKIPKKNMIEVVLDNSAVKCGQLAFLSIIRSLKTMLYLVKKNAINTLPVKLCL